MPHLLAGLPLLPVLRHHGAPAAPHVISSVTCHLNTASKRTEDTQTYHCIYLGFSSGFIQVTTSMDGTAAFSSEAIMNHDFR